jgi:dipeptidase E
MRSLFLAGGGGAEDSRDLDQLFVERLGPAKGFAYVPVAMEPDHHPACRAWITSVFAALGVRRIDTWTSLAGKTLADLRVAGEVYIGGGDTTRLLREVRRSGFADALRVFAEEGGTVYGGSAGAILLGASIKTALEASALRAGEASGLDLLAGYSIACHYVPDAREAVARLTRFVGTSVAFTQRGITEIAPGEPVDLAAV